MLHDKEIQRQRSILQASIRAEEKQKQFLGRELHDGLGQMLAYISLNLQLMLDKQTPVEEIVEKTKALINKAIADIRQLSRTLIPVALDSTKSLKEILTESLVTYANMKGLRFDFVVYDPMIDQKLSQDQKHSIFRIIQELTNNTIKYADANLITLSIRDTGKQCAIRYTDDGRGFVVKKIKKGVGTESIETRVESYKGTVSIQSGKGKGVKVQISIPYGSKLKTAVEKR
jgi:signal transduction histidine kinase